MDRQESIPEGEAGFETLKKEPPSEKKKVELKILPNHLKYVFLQEDDAKTIVISNALTKEEENRLVDILKKHKEAIGWHILNLKGISPAYCIHRIMMEDNNRPV